MAIAGLRVDVSVARSWVTYPEELVGTWSGCFQVVMLESIGGYSLEYSA